MKLVLGDLAENYQFPIQNENQSYNCSRKYCTLQPLIINHRDAEDHVHLFLSVLFLTTTFMIQISYMKGKP